MESDSKTIKKIQRAFANVSDVFSTLWLRFPVQTDNGNHWFILDSRYSFLWNLRIFLAIVYITFKAFE